MLSIPLVWEIAEGGANGGGGRSRPALHCLDLAVVVCRMAASKGPRYVAREDPTLPNSWRALVDGNTGYLYFWNPITNVTQYEKPNPDDAVDALEPHLKYRVHYLKYMQTDDKFFFIVGDGSVDFRIPRSNIKNSSSDPSQSQLFILLMLFSHVFLHLKESNFSFLLRKFFDACWYL